MCSGCGNRAQDKIAVILSVPFGLAGSFLFAKMFGLENNIYLQTGLIMLIGLLSKTAILLTEYASERRRQGMTITQAAVSAAQVRLRPILMTSLTMIFGMLPMMFASGVGANGNISIGVGTVGGMLIGTVAHAWSWINRTTVIRAPLFQAGTCNERKTAP